MLMILPMVLLFGVVVQSIAVIRFGKETGIWLHKRSSKEDVRAIRASKYGLHYRVGEWILIGGLVAMLLLAARSLLA